MVKSKLNIFFSSIFSGLLIGIGGIIFISLLTINKIIGSLMFGFGLFTIIYMKQWLYTGKIGYVLANKKEYLLELLICLIGNLIGAVATGYLCRLTLLINDTRYVELVNNAINVCNVKLNSSWLSIFILSMFCGVMIYLAVEISKLEVSDVVKVIGIFLAVAIFILSGFEHCVANMFYFSLANMWGLKTILYVLIMILGNSVGSILVYLLLKLTKK